MALEQTFSIIKPNAVQKNAIGEIIARFEKRGLRIAAAKFTHLTREKAEGFYIEHKDKVVYSELPAYWYLGGLQSLYHLNHSFIISAFPQQFDYKKAQRVSEVWRYLNGQMIPDSDKWMELYQEFK